MMSFLALPAGKKHAVVGLTDMRCDFSILNNHIDCEITFEFFNDGDFEE